MIYPTNVLVLFDHSCCFIVDYIPEQICAFKLIINVYVKFIPTTKVVQYMHILCEFLFMLLLRQCNVRILYIFFLK